MLVIDSYGGLCSLIREIPPLVILCYKTGVCVGGGGFLQGTVHKINP